MNLSYDNYDNYTALGILAQKIECKQFNKFINFLYEKKAVFSADDYDLLSLQEILQNGELNSKQESGFYFTCYIGKLMISGYTICERQGKKKEVIDCRVGIDFKDTWDNFSRCEVVLCFPMRVCDWKEAKERINNMLLYRYSKVYYSYKDKVEKHKYNRVRNLRLKNSKNRR